ncbi:MAG: hypothetical protein ACTHLE_15385 [Agriterribacter sp.]
MKINNSGRFYAVPLDFQLGYYYCYINDFTDIDPFSGLVIYLISSWVKTSNEIITVQEIKNTERLFGPVPLNKIPNVKGKNAWKSLGQVKDLDDRVPSFKYTQNLITLQKTNNWCSVSGWKKVLNFYQYSGPVDYEDVRYLETTTLYDMQGIIIRTTMHHLLLNKKKVQNYYDLNDSRIRMIYLQMVNTSFDKKLSEKYLAVL